MTHQELNYDVLILSSAEKEMNKLQVKDFNRISKKILSLEKAPRPRGFRKLTNREEYRLRVGDYRVLYSIDDSNQLITVLAVGHRREVYH